MPRLTKLSILEFVMRKKDGFGTPRGNAQGDFFNGLSLAPGDGREVEAS